jgi:hypothetical protein
MQGLPLHAVGPLHPETELLDKRHVSCYTEIVEIPTAFAFLLLMTEQRQAISAEGPRRVSQEETVKEPLSNER